MKLLGGMRLLKDICFFIFLCIKICKYDLKLGLKGFDGCFLCVCVKLGNCIIINKKINILIVIFEN